MSDTAPVSVRVTAAERDLLTTAAKQAHTNLSDFIRRKAIEAAEMEVMDSRTVTIPAEDWDRFEAWVRSPPKDMPNLRKQLLRPLAWED